MSRSRMPVCSTTRVKSATVFSLMVDGSGSRCCRIFGRLRPVRIVMKSDAMAPSKRGPSHCANHQLDCAQNRSGALLMVDVDNLAWSQTRKERGRWFTPAFGADRAHSQPDLTCAILPKCWRMSA